MGKYCTGLTAAMYLFSNIDQQQNLSNKMQPTDTDWKGTGQDGTLLLIVPYSRTIDS